MVSRERHLRSGPDHSGWDDKYRQALHHGYHGLRGFGQPLFPGNPDWNVLRQYEIQLTDLLKDKRASLVCSYSVTEAAELLDVAGHHHLAIVRRGEEWATAGTPGQLKHGQAAHELEPRQVSERLLLATRAAGIGIWDWDVENDELVWDDQMYRLYGVRKDDFREAYDAWASSLAPEDLGRANAALRAALHGEREFNQEFRIIWPDGSTHFIQAAARTFWDEDGKPTRLVGLNFDITERKQAEERIALLQTITMDMAATQDLPSALEVVLRRVCQKTGWALGQAWIPRHDGTGLDCCPAWFGSAPHLKEFELFSGNITLARGSGLPGRVWASGQPAWIRDVTQDTNFPRGEAARKSGLKAALGVPIRSGDEVIAILEFFLSEPREEDERLVEVITAVAAQIGLVLERKRAEESLRWSEERFAKAFQASPEPITIFRHRDGVLLEVNERWQAVYGYTREEAVGNTTLDLTMIRPKERDRLRGLLEKEHSIREVEVDLKTKQNAIRHISLSAEQIVINGEVCDIYLHRDITERKQAEEMLRLSESRLADAQRVAHVGYWERNLDSGEIVWSDEVFRILGIPQQKPLESLEPLVHPEDLPLQREARGRLLRGEAGEAEYRVVRPDGDVRLLHIQTRVIRDESSQHRRTFGTMQDVTELKRAEEQLKATSEQLRALSARLQTAREEEGIRIAREIHDDLGSVLTSLRWNLEALSTALTEPGPPSPTLKNRVVDMLELSDKSISTVRRIAAELRPTVLDVLGLAEAIQWQTRQFHDRTGIQVNLASQLNDVDFTREQSTAVFRILQEALTNILRHSRATGVDVTMSEKAGLFELVIRDNGRGITPTERSGPASLGLLGMRERAHLVGGTIEITSAAPDEGTTVTMRMPVVASDDSEIDAKGATSGV